MTEAAPNAVILVSLETGRVLYANRMGLTLAANPPDLASLPACQALPAPIAAGVEQVRRSGQTAYQEAVPLPPGPGRSAASVWDITYTVLPGAPDEAPAILITAHDVTRHVLERREAEQARDTLDALLAHIPEGITIAYGQNVRVERVSAYGLEMARRLSLELIGQDALQHGPLWEVRRLSDGSPVPPEDRPMARAIRTGAVTRNETLLMGRPDGTKIPLLCSAGPIRSREGHVIGAVLCWRDVTELVAAQKALAANECRLRAILQQIPAAIFIVESAEGEATFQNDRLAKVLANPNLSNTEARQTLRGWALHEDGTPYRLDEYPSRRAFSQGVTIEGEPMIYRRPDGQIVNLEMYAGPIRDSEGRIIAAVGIVSDVTERKRQEEALRESEARFRVAIEAGGLATYEIDLVRGQTELDPTFARMLGLPPETFLGSRADGRSFVHPEDLPRVQAELDAVIAARGSYTNEFRAIAADGRVVWLANRGRVVLDQAGNPLRVAGVVRDVTARRNREDALREALAARELLVREADHRIKNSLQLVCSVLSLQKTRLASPDLGAALDDAISRVQAVAEAHRALHQSADLRSIDFGTMLNDLCTHAANLSPAIVFRCHCPEPIDLDTERAIPLGLIVSELLTNAAKYAYDDAGGIVTLTAMAETGSVEIAVADQGRGIPAESRDGRGIGSRIIAAVAKQIGATVDTTSGPGGTTVRLRFSR
jgi:PAS domain S-box-containing protein